MVMQQRIVDTKDGEIIFKETKDSTGTYVEYYRKDDTAAADEYRAPIYIGESDYLSVPFEEMTDGELASLYNDGEITFF